MPYRIDWKLTGPRVAALALLALAAAGLPAGAAEPATHADLLAMVEAGLSEEIVLEWLATREPPPPPSADELIALKEAGASDRLLRALLRPAAGADGRATEASPADAQGPPVDTPGGTSVERPATPPATAPRTTTEVEPTTSLSGGAPTPTTPAEKPAAPAARVKPSGQDSSDVLVTFRLSYLPRFDEDEEEWDFFVYLDGEPLSFVPPSSLAIQTRTLEFHRRLAPGRHLVRVSQERHLRKRRERWQHAARVAGEELAFELRPGPPAQVELSFRQGSPLRGGNDPLTFRAIQEDQVVEVEEVGGDPERWPPLCEEAAPKPAKGCVRWSDLWPGRSVPSLEEIRNALALFDFRPVPKGS